MSLNLTILNFLLSYKLSYKVNSQSREKKKSELWNKKPKLPYFS